MCINNKIISLIFFWKNSQCTQWASSHYAFFGYNPISITDISELRSIHLCQLIFKWIMEYHTSLSLDQSFIACFWNPYVRSVENKDCLTTHADDNQVYMVINPIATRATIAAGLEACLSDISDWMTTNILKINQDETELIIFSPKNKPGCISRLNYKFWWSDHLGIILCTLGMDDQNVWF